MKFLSPQTFISIFILGLIGFMYLRTTDIYLSNELQHLEDRIRFGRLEYNRNGTNTNVMGNGNSSIEVGNLKVSIEKKILQFFYMGEQIFKGENEPFLKLMQAQGNIYGNGDSFYDIEDNVKEICKVQYVDIIREVKEEGSKDGRENISRVEIQGWFLDCYKEETRYRVVLIEENGDSGGLKNQSADNTTTGAHAHAHPHSHKNQLKIQTKILSPSKKYQRVSLIFPHSKQNQYYGLGEQFSYLNLGHDRPYSTYVRQKGVGRSQQPLTLIVNLLHGAGGSYFTSYAPMPIWFTSRRVGYILNDYSYMAWVNNKILVWGDEFEVLVYKGNSYKDVVGWIGDFNGYNRQVPDWVNNGALLGLQGGTEEVMRKFSQIKEAGAKVTGLWLQDWVSKRMSLGFSRLWWNWQLDRDHYKDWGKMQDQLHAQNVYLLLYVNPMLSDASLKSNHRHNMYNEAAQKGLFVKNKKGQIFNSTSVSDYEISTLDFQNPKAVQFFKDVLQDALNETEANGMMVDFSEGYPAEEFNGTIEQGARKHNQYSTLYHRKVYEIIRELKGEENDFYIFTRAGYLKSPKYAHSLWAGDQNMNFNFHTGLPSCLTAILSSGLVGYSTTHCDIGGYVSIKTPIWDFADRTEILMVRWMQLSAFTAVFRSHEGNNPANTLHIYSNPLMLYNFAFYSRVYEALSKYRAWQSDISALERVPLVRALFLELNGLEGTEEIQDQFYLGNEIIVAPFMTPKAERKYFLPRGEWRSIWDGKIIKGCDCQRVWVDGGNGNGGGFGFPPVLIKSSSQYSEGLIENVGKLIEEYGNKIKMKVIKESEDL